MDTDIGVQLRRLESAEGEIAPPFGYDALMSRHANRQSHVRRRHRVARATAGALVIALVGASVWRLAPHEAMQTVDATAAPVQSLDSQPRLVRADTYLAVAALEDHIARVDDALNDARLLGGSDEVTRLERTRAELVSSYASVRYAETVSAHF